MSELGARDRRGLGEIVTWASVLIVIGVLNIVYMMFSVGEGKLRLDPVLLGSLTGAVTALVARGTQGASERSGSTEAFNQAASELRDIIRDVNHNLRTLIQSTIINRGEDK